MQMVKAAEITYFCHVCSEYALWLMSGLYFAKMQNGEVFVFTGMLDAVTDVHQLTIVLAHEMAHVVLGHAVSI